MLILTTEKINGHEHYNTIGLVEGSVVRSKNVGRDIGASIKSIFGGEIKSYTKMQEEARELATNRMIEQAKEQDADAIVCVRFTSSTAKAGASEILAYGTAIKFK